MRFLPSPFFQRAAAAALYVAFLVLQLHDYYAQTRSRLLTAIFTAAALLFIVCILLARLWGGKRSRQDSGPERSYSVVGKVLGRVVAALVCILCMVLALAPKWHSSLFLTVWSVSCTSLAVLLLLFSEASVRPSVCAMACVFLLFIASPQPYQGLPFFIVKTPAVRATIAASFAVLTVCALLNLNGRSLLLVCVASGVALRALAAAQWQLNAIVRDMLPLIESALSSFLEGLNPYRMYFLSHEVPLTYLPVLWLSHLPAFLAGVDIRWTSILAAAASCLLIYRWGASAPPDLIGQFGAEGVAAGAARVREGKGALGLWLALRALASYLRQVPRALRKTLPAETEPPFLVAAVIFAFQPEIFWNAVHGEPPVYWLWLILFLTAVFAARVYVAALLLGVLIATRHFGFLFVPFFAVWLRTGGWPWRDVASAILLAGATAAILVLPWILLNPDSFLYGTFEWLVKYGPAYRTAWDFQIGLQSWFYGTGKESWLWVLQVALYALITLATATAVFWTSRRGERGGVAAATLLWTGCCAAYIAFLYFAAMIWKSFLVSPFLPALAAMFPIRERWRGRLRGQAISANLAPTVVGEFASPRPRLSGASRHVLGLRFAVWLATLATLNAAGLVVVLSAFHGWKERDDIVSFARQGLPLLKEGDLLVDYGYLNAWHVFQGSPFSTLSVPHGVTVTQRPRSVDFSRFFRIVIFDGYSLHSLQNEFPDLLVSSRLVYRKKSGRSTLSIFASGEPLQDGWRLASDPWALKEAEMTTDKPPTFVGRREGSSFVFDGLAPWIWIGSSPCVAGGAQHDLIFAHLVEGRRLRMKVSLPTAGEVWLRTAVDDRLLVRARDPLQIEVSTATGLRKLLLHPGKPGIFSWRLGQLPAGELTIEVSMEDRSPDKLCFDVVVGP